MLRFLYGISKRSREFQKDFVFLKLNASPPSSLWLPARDLISTRYMCTASPWRAALYRHGSQLLAKAGEEGFLIRFLEHSFSATPCRSKVGIYKPPFNHSKRSDSLHCGFCHYAFLFGELWIITKIVLLYCQSPTPFPINSYNSKTADQARIMGHPVFEKMQITMPKATYS